MALIDGSDPKYVLKRTFCKKKKGSLPGIGESDFIEFKVEEPGLYQFCKFCGSADLRNWEWEGFAVILESSVREISYETATGLVSEAETSGQPLLTVIRSYVAQTEVPQSEPAAVESVTES
jgi:hypothetical protein